MIRKRRAKVLETIGASGAEIILIEGTEDFDLILKRDRSRPRMIVDQGEFMREVGTSVFPKIFTVGNDHYLMEKLNELVLTDAEQRGGIIPHMKTLLRIIWGESVLVPLGDCITMQHRAYVSDRMGPHQDLMFKWLDKMKDYDVTAVSRIHGDPTVENLMLRGGDELVFIDPLPSDQRIPSLMAVDLGKILQSVWRYEHIKRHGETPYLWGDRQEMQHDLFVDVREEDAELARYFFCLHIGRLIPYQPTHLRPTFWNMLELALKVEYAP